VPRIMPFPPGELPPKLAYYPAAARGKIYFIADVIRVMQGHFDLVICGHINLLPLAVLVQIKIRTPLVLMAYGIDVWKQHRSIIVRRLIGRVNKVWAISAITRDKMRAWVPITESKFSILPNAIDLSSYGVGPKNPELTRRYALEGHRVILLLARLVDRERYKGVDEVLDIMPNLLKKIPDLVFVVAGDGSDKARLEQKATALGIRSNVVFTGFVAESEKRDLFRLADLFVMPSRREGFGFVFLEALACGVPVVASRLDGSREAVRDGTLGRLVDPANPAELEEAIIAGLDDPHGVPYGLSYFAFPQFQRRLSILIQDAINK